MEGTSGNVGKECASARNSRNTNYCCVPQCNNYAGSGISLHLFPKDPALKKLWEVSLKMGKPTTSSMRVCSTHFLPTDYFPGSHAKRKLFPKSVPTQNLPRRSHDVIESTHKTVQRAARKKRMSSSSTSSDAKQVSAAIEQETGFQEHKSSESEDINASFMCTVGAQANLADFRKTRFFYSTPGLADFFAA